MFFGGLFLFGVIFYNYLFVGVIDGDNMSESSITDDEPEPIKGKIYKEASIRFAVVKLVPNVKTS